MRFFEIVPDYYRFHGQSLTPPKDLTAMPAREFLAYHAEVKFR